MRLAAWLWLLPLTGVTSCAGDYPLAPTPCDDYCHATRDLQCDFYSPAACVQNCERSGYGLPKCREPLSKLLGCFESTPGAAASYCSAFGWQLNLTPSCSLELSALLDCAGQPTSFGGAP